ncbi:MAG: uridine kinase [Saprospiraceae bacterium]|nr:uridine kinase [Saprospiraceae bacterium]
MKPLVIGICGGSGSGKTSFIRSLRHAFTTAELCIISQDDYYRPIQEQRTDAQGIHNFDRPAAVDKKALRHDLECLMRGEVVERLEYTFNNPLASPAKLVFHPAPVIIVEGLFVFHFKKLRPCFDLKLFVNAKENLKVIRRIRRDQIERNYPIEDVLYRYEHHVLPAYERYVLPYREEADLVINNNDDFERALRVLGGFLRQHLNGRSANE